MAQNGLTTQKVQAMFLSWLSLKAPETINNVIIPAIPDLNAYCKLNHIGNDSFFNLQDILSLNSLYRMINGDRLYKLFHKHFADLLLLIKWYEIFIEAGVLSEIEKKPPLVPKPAVVPSAPKTSQTKPTLPVRSDKEVSAIDPLTAYAKTNALSFVDKRPQQGTFWLVEGVSLQKHIDKLQTMGYFFRRSEAGGKSTKGREAWYLYRQPKQMKEAAEPDNKTFEDHPSLEPDLQQLLVDDDLQPLRNALAKHNLVTVASLRAINLWQFMNMNTLYNISQRQEVLNRVTARLKEVNDTATKQKYALETSKAVYYGNTPAEVFLHFCKFMAQKYPLKMCNCVGKKHPIDDVTVLAKKRATIGDLELPFPVAYIDHLLTMKQVFAYSKWLCVLCKESAHPIGIKGDNQPEPQKPVIPIEPADKKDSDSSSLQPINPEPIVQPPKPEPENGNEVSIKKAEELVLAADLSGITKEALSVKLDASVAATQRYIQASKRIVSLNGKLYHEDAFVDWDDGAAQMEVILEKLLDKNNGYASAAQFVEYVRAEMQMFLNDNDMDDPRMIFDMAQHLFEKVNYHGKSFTFQFKSHISRNENAVTSSLELIQLFARVHGGFFAEEDLEEYLQKAGLKTGNLRGQMQVYSKPIFLFYAEHTYMTVESMGMDAQWFDTAKQALKRMFADMGDHIVLRDIDPWYLTLLPALPGGRSWTLLLFQSVLGHFSKKLDDAHTIFGLEGQTGDTLHAMLVSGDSEVQSFCDAVVAFLVDEEIDKRQFDAEELRQMLVNRGMVAGNELIWKLPKALGNDPRFAWSADGQNVIVKV